MKRLILAAVGVGLFGGALAALPGAVSAAAPPPPPPCQPNMATSGNPLSPACTLPGPFPGEGYYSAPVSSPFYAPAGATFGPDPTA